MRQWIFAVFMVVMALSPALADDYVVQLVDVQGTYPYLDENGFEHYSRRHTFVYNGPAASITDVVVSLEGVAEVGSLLCCYATCQTVPWYAHISSTLIGPDKLSRRYGESSDDVGGAFAVVFNLVNSGGLPLDAIATGDTLSVLQYLVSGGNDELCYPLTDVKGGTISSASLRLIVSPTSPIVPTTWGRIKVLYDTDT